MWVYVSACYAVHLPSNQGAQEPSIPFLADLTMMSGSGSECRTMAPYSPYSAIMVDFPHVFSVLRHLARLFWNQTYIQRSYNQLICHVIKVKPALICQVFRRPILWDNEQLKWPKWLIKLGSRIFEVIEKLQWHIFVAHWQSLCMVCGLLWPFWSFMWIKSPKQLSAL